MKKNMKLVFLGIGSNIDAENNMQKCADLIRSTWPNVVFSKVYLSKAQDEEEQDDFLNAVVKIEIDNQSTKEVADLTQDIENKLKKNTPYPKGPRTIDIDILLVGDEIIEINDIQIPHTKMHERRFVLEPLCELIDSETIHPTLNISMIDLLKKTQDQACTETNIVL